jgi:F0F1-type ATP synthase membrane subunit b/b'
MIEFNATFLIAMLSFAVFIIIMNAIFYEPILSIIKKREDYINSNINTANGYENTAQEYTKKHADEIDKKQEECRIEFKNTVEILQTEATEKIRVAKEITKSKIQSQKDELSKNSDELKKNINNTVIGDLASSITEKLTQGVIQ